MCLINIAPKGTEKYTQEFKRAVFEGIKKNSDGVGFAWTKKKSTVVHFSKGYMKDVGESYIAFTDRVFNNIEKLKLSKDDILIVHHRTSTSGSLKKENTHPFVIDTKHDARMEDIAGHLNGICKNGVMFHNGGFHGQEYRLDPLYNDTAHFVWHVFSDGIELLNMLKRSPSKFEEILNSEISYNKLAFLVPGKVITIGDFIKDSETGYLHSNNTYKPSSNQFDMGGKLFPVYPHQHANGYVDEEAAWRDEYSELNSYPSRLRYTNPLTKAVPILEISEFTDAEEFDPAADLEEVFSRAGVQLDAFSDEPATSSPFKSNGVLNTLADVEREIQFYKHLGQAALKFIIDTEPIKAGHMSFKTNEDLCSTIKKGQWVRITSYNPKDSTVMVSATGDTKITYHHIGSEFFFESVTIVPVPHWYEIYDSCITLLFEGEPTHKTIKHLEKVVLDSKTPNETVKIEQPSRFSLNVEGLRLYLRMIKANIHSVVKIPENCYIY
jgi:hypothetical protein